MSPNRAGRPLSPVRPTQLPAGRSRASSYILTTPASDAPAVAFPTAMTMTRMLPTDTMSHIIHSQQETLHRLRTTNDALETFNHSSAARYLLEAKQMHSYTKLLRDVKVDLDHIFRRIRFLKASVASNHPTEFARAGGSLLDDDNDSD
ncbi:hypothetical protein SeMB42_g02848 [Synchytrium endobioticum]|uniref:KxDL domain-containing protein n=1 Tax=Synchytrium endobioticum TaxID=286115 RepID=A0A507DBH1_9FUNG|nr:hypothetical protein SeLEV6574_g06792 [Synchytrium endobioticum]TPX48836.1 hypothetical protein SeMB42_g02848 [Synchytrium endobioticum]